jgi:hypothetical protein
MKKVAVPVGSGAVVIRTELVLKRVTEAWVELRSDDMVIRTPGPVTYDMTSRTALLAGGVRVQTPKMRVRSARAMVVFAEPGRRERSGEAAPPKQGDDDARAEDVDIERIVLDGSVLVETPPTNDAPGRVARATRAVYSSSGGGVVSLTGEPAPTVDMSGVVLTAPDLRIHLKDSSIASPGGAMKALVRRSGDEP